MPSLQDNPKIFVKDGKAPDVSSEVPACVERLVLMEIEGG
jgi:hypothetical protein